MKKGLKEIEQNENNSHSYTLPAYVVGADGLENVDDIVINFVKGSKENPIQSGFCTETLIELCILHLEKVNVGELSSRETSLAITKLQEANLWLGKRAEDRKNRGVLNTMKK